MFEAEIPPKTLFLQHISTIVRITLPITKDIPDCITPLSFVINFFVSIVYVLNVSADKNASTTESTFVPPVISAATNTPIMATRWSRR